MTRRAFVPAAAAAGAAMSLAASDKPCILELTRYQLRNTQDNQRDRLSKFFESALLPAFERSGSGPVGVFGNSIAADGPFLMTLTSFASLAAYESAREKMAADKVYTQALEKLNGLAGLAYERMERSLLRAFDSVPALEVPPGGRERPARLYELRMYESNNSSTLARKIAMFGAGETAIFRRVGMQVVFFGETIVGPKMPNLTYMVGYDDLAARDKAWKAFGGDPEWQKMRSTPGWADAEIVSNITNYLVSPLGYSKIR